MIDPTGRPLAKPTHSVPLLRITEWVHLTDRRTCIPFLINIVHTDLEPPGMIGGVGFATDRSWPLNPVPRDPHPEIPPKIAIPGAAPTWHWPDECPWHK